MTTTTRFDLHGYNGELLGHVETSGGAISAAMDFDADTYAKNGILSDGKNYWNYTRYKKPTPAKTRRYELLNLEGCHISYAEAISQIRAAQVFSVNYCGAGFRIICVDGDRHPAEAQVYAILSGGAEPYPANEASVYSDIYSYNAAVYDMFGLQYCIDAAPVGSSRIIA